MAIPLAGNRSALDAYLSRQSKPQRHGMNPALECTSYLHSSAALRTGGGSEEHYCHWSLAPLKLERHPVSLIWNQRNAAVRPVVAQLAQAMSRSLRF